MFEVKPYKSIISGLHEIVDNEVILLNDGSNDILYSGTNKFGNRILGTVVCEDIKETTIRYFHILITDENYIDFFNRRKTLRQILNESEGFFIVDKDFNENIKKVNLASFQDIPDSYLPLENSFCPSFVYDASLEYTFSLKGGLADQHKVEPEVMNDMNSNFCKVLKSSSTFANDLGMVVHIYSEPAMTGSFELNFKIELTQQQNLFSKPTIDINTFLFNFYNYIFDKLPNEPQDVFKADVVNSVEFKKLEKEYVAIHSSRGIDLTDQAKEDGIINLITYSVDNFREVEYNGFDRVQITNKSQEGKDVPVALINNDFYKSIEEKVFKPEEINKPPLIEIDAQPTEYKILVYDLNTESGNGKVYLEIPGTDTRVRAISLYLSGKENYDHTAFTQSMNEKSFILVKGIAKKVDKEYKTISYKFEN